MSIGMSHWLASHRRFNRDAIGPQFGFGQYTGMLHHTRRPSVGPSAQPAYLARVLFLVGVRFGFVVCGLLFFFSYRHFSFRGPKRGGGVNACLMLNSKWGLLLGQYWRT